MIVNKIRKMIVNKIREMIVYKFSIELSGQLNQGQADQTYYNIKIGLLLLLLLYNVQ